ncbi:MAG: hypothetical protein HQ534_02875 [Armatimonadetes bacterium]|nr:hypothetical protein [Armatimonadota bacterium]
MLHPHHHPRPPEWIVSEEKIRSVKEIGEIISQIGQKLEDKLEVSLSGHKVKPASNSTFILRYERTPHNDFVLKIEVKWPADHQGNVSNSDTIVIE